MILTMQTNYFGTNRDDEQSQDQRDLEFLGTILAECLEKRALLDELRDDPPTGPAEPFDSRDILKHVIGYPRRRELSRELGYDE